MRIIVDRGRNARAIANYLHRADKREIGKEQDDPVFHTNMFGRNAEERTEELRFSADLNQKVEKTYVHYKVSFPPGENPDLETKKGIVDDLLKAQEHGQNCQFFAVEHYEKIDQHNVHHLHVLSSSVRLDGSWVDDAFDRVKLKQVERDIEQKWGLQYCPPKEKGDRNSNPIREWKLREKLQSEGKILVKDDLRGAIDEAARDHPSMSLLVTRLKAEGYSVQFHEFKDGGKGISYATEGKPFKGRDLGNRYSFEGLHEYTGVDYQPERDDPLLRELNRMTSEQCQEVIEPFEKIKETVLPKDHPPQLQQVVEQNRLRKLAKEQEQKELEPKLKQEQQKKVTRNSHRGGFELE